MSKAKEKAIQFIRDFIFGTAGLLFMNGVLSLLVYPFLERELTAAGQGKILFYMAVAGLMGATFGSGASYGRLKIQTEERKTVNGEYHRFFLITAALLVPVTALAILLKGERGGATAAGLYLVILFTTLRHYGDVEYRLNLTYGRFSLYYLLIGLGYLLGILLYRITGRWVLIFLAGEGAGLLYVWVTGSIFRGSIREHTPECRRHLKDLFALSGSFFLSDFVSAADRLLFPLLLVNGDQLTAVYYYSSLVGKMMSLISSPLNGVLSGYLAREEGGMKKKTFLRLVLFMLLLWAAVTAFAVLGSLLFVYLFYCDYLETVRPLLLLANAGQVIFFICNTMMVVVLRYTRLRNQVIVSSLYVAAFFLVTVPLILRIGVRGMAIGLFTVNTLKFVLFVFLGLRSLGKVGAADPEEMLQKGAADGRQTEKE